MKDCSICHEKFPNQQDFQEMVKLINDFIHHESFKKVHFVLMSHAQAHKRTVSALASQLIMEQNMKYFLAYYSFDDYQADAFYDWSNQCLENNCQLVNAVLNSEDDFEDEMPISYGVSGFANGADLAITATMQSYEKICPDSQMKHSEHVFVFLTPFHDDKYEFPLSIVEKHLTVGCKLIVLTFNENHYRAALQLADSHQNGEIKAFLVTFDNFENFATCIEECHCENDVKDYIDSCGKYLIQFSVSPIKFLQFHSDSNFRAKLHKVQ